MCHTLGLSFLKEKLEQNLIKNIKTSKNQLNLVDLLEDFALANKYHLDDYLSTFMEQKNLVFKKPDANEFDVDLMMSYVSNSTIPDAVSYELTKNTINSFFENVTVRRGELDSILLFLDLIFYDDRVVDLSSRQKTKKLPFRKQVMLNEDVDSTIRKLERASDDDGRATLVLEGRHIHVNSFVLTDNSPVFKAMLSSHSFKEGQTKTVELPGKNLDHFVYFLEFLQDSTKVIDGKI